MSTTSDVLGLLDSTGADADRIADQLQSLRSHLALARLQLGSGSVPPLSDPPVISNPPASPSRDPAGFTFLAVASDARLIYVSASEGSATNDGLSPQKPLDSIAKAAQLLRDNSGDRLLLKAGDRFDARHGVAGNWSRSGRSATEPIVIGAYGSGPRPYVACAEPFLNLWSGPAVKNLAVVGLHFSAAQRDPAAADFLASASVSHGLRILKATENLLLEDCIVELFETNIAISQGTNIAVRRCVVVDAWATTAAYSGQGLYVEKSDGLLVEECLFDHNGWNERIAAAKSNLFRHNLYLQSTNSGAVTLRGNVIARAGSHGAWMRSGGSCEQNLFYDNALHVQIAGEQGTVAGNLIVGGRDIDAQTPRGYGITLFSRLGAAHDNLLAAKPGTVGYAIGADKHDFTAPGERRTEISGNLVMAWCGPGIDAENPPDELLVSGNSIFLCPRGKPAVLLRKLPKRSAFTANRYQLAIDARPDQAFQIAERFMNFADWTAASGESGAAFVADTAVPPVPAAISGPIIELHIAEWRSRGRAAWNRDSETAALITAVRSLVNPQVL